MIFKRWTRRLLVTSGLLLGAVTAASAQDETGRIEGRVIKEGKGVAGVAVLVNELSLIEVTDSKGAFTFKDVAPGRYNVIFTLGNNSTTRENVFVTAGKPHVVDLDVDWDLGITEEVTVTAAERAAKIVDAPAAVTSIPVEQIAREAAHGQVPKILEFTPGAEVTQSGLYDFNFNTRGFNSSLNRRVSTYIDGRDVGVVLLGAQEWAAISGGVDDMAALEFIRGPSAALYGANASSGVVNITTKPPRGSEGSMVRVTAGELDTRSVDFRHAGEMAGGWYHKIIAGFKNSGDFSIARDPDTAPQPEYSVYCGLIGETDCLPEEKALFRNQDNDISFTSARFDKYFEKDGVLTIEAGMTDIEGPIFQTGIGRVQIRDAERPFFRVAYATDRWNVLGHFAARNADQANLTRDLVVDFGLITDTKRWGFEGQGNWRFFGDKMRIVAGAAYTKEHVDTKDPETGLQTVVFQTIDTHREAIFSQLDYKLNDHIKFVFAGRFDRNTLHDTQFSPKAAMVYSMTPKHSLRFTYNEAFQVANYSEFFLHAKIARFPLLGFASVICGSPVLPSPVDCGITENAPILAVGNDDLKLEQTEAFEIGYSGLFSNKVFVTVDYYNSTNSDFITDLIQQVGTGLGNTDGCVDSAGNPVTDPTRCPINNDYGPWVSTKEAETTILFGNITVAQALRNAVDNSVGGNSLGFRLATDLDGSTVVVGRTYANVGEVDTQGVDLGVQYFISKDWSLQASYSWFDFKTLDENQDIEEILLPNSPEHKGSLSVSVNKNRWGVSLSGRWVQGFRWSAGVFKGDVDDYSNVDLAARFDITPQLTWGLNVANLRDTINRQTFGGDLLERRALTHLTYNW